MSKGRRNKRTRSCKDGAGLAEKNFRNLLLNRTQALRDLNELLANLPLELSESRDEVGQDRGKRADRQLSDLMNLTRKWYSSAATTLTLRKLVRTADHSAKETATGTANFCDKDVALQRVNSVAKAEDFVHEVRN